MSSVVTKFVTTTSDKLNTVTVVNGQVIALSDKVGWYYDMNNTRREIPTSVFSGCTDVADGTAGLVPGPETTDAGKFLSSNGTWASLGLDDYVTDTELNTVLEHLVETGEYGESEYKLVTYSDFSTLSGDVSDLSNTVSGLSSDLSNLSGTVNTLSGDVSSLSTTVSGLTTRLEALELHAISDSDYVPPTIE